MMSDAQKCHCLVGFSGLLTGFTYKRSQVRVLLSPPENPLFSGFFHVPEIVHFVNLTSKSHRNDVKNDVKFDVKNDVRIPGENRRTIRVYRLP